MKIAHPCIPQVRIALQGPGSLTGSPNYFTSNKDVEVTLLTSIAQFNATHCLGGTFDFHFNDAHTRRLQDCCIPAEQLSGPIQSTGKLSEFLGSTMFSNWSLIIEDLSSDHISGQILSWEIEFTSFPCVPKYTWVNLTTSLASHLTIPPARYAPMSIAYEDYFFVYGGRDSTDRVLNDLYRYDIRTKLWTSLTPIQWIANHIAVKPSMAMGSNYLMTTWGLIRFGGLFRLSAMATKHPQHAEFLSNPKSKQTSSQYDNTLMILDPVTMHWESVNITAYSQRTYTGNSVVARQEETVWYTDPITGVVGEEHGTTTNTAQAKGTMLQSKIAFPTGRYLSSMVFLPASVFQWKATSDWTTTSTHSHHPLMSDQNLFGHRYVTSYQANYQNVISDSVLLFGGFDGATGSMVDGSSGGYLSDIWVFRMNEWSTVRSRSEQVKYQETHCRWRKNTSAKTAGLLNCISPTANAGTTCAFRDLMMLVWCDNFNQTMS